MEILRQPPGHRDDQASPPPRNPFIRFVFAVLFLVIGLVVFFIGGLVVRNPELPNYLLDRIVRGFHRAATGSTSADHKGHVSSAENLKPPPSPTTPEQYLNLMSYNENALPSDERAAASVLNQACDSVTTLVDLLSKNPSKWKRNSQGNVLFTSKTLYDQFNAATQDLNSAIKALNGD